MPNPAEQNKDIKIRIIGQEGLIHEQCRLYNTKVGQYTEVGLLNYMENVILGDFSYTGEYCIIQNAEIGKFANIAAMARIGPPNHPMERPALHHFTYRSQMYGLAGEDDKQFFQWRAQQKIHIGHDTWIGHGAIIMPGVKIGHGAVVGAGAVVTKDVEPYTIVAGVSAQPIRRRFTKDTAAKLLAIRWWDWPYEVIRKRLDDFYLPIQEFTKKYEAGE